MCGLDTAVGGEGLTIIVLTPNVIPGVKDARIFWPLADLGVRFQVTAAVCPGILGHLQRTLPGEY